MKQLIFNFGELSIVCNLVGKQLCFIYKCGIPIWAGYHEELIEILQSTLDKP